MDEIAIRAEHVGKRYRLGARAPYHRLTDTLAGLVSGPFRRGSRGAGDAAAAGREPPPTEFWALKDVSFEIPRGEVTGIIGRNGAGKSTLLKVLSRVTEMTEGQAEIRGRVGSLLEVGNGFHPELTGRENIYLNAAILGMGRAEVRSKFDEIVAFAEVEKFLDTPVKRYSSGMYMRLAFAVAAHLEPEILLVDEVLAVGDAAFQKKCLGKMGEVAKGGRTILFISHQLNSIRRLCHRCIWLDRGRVRLAGETAAVVSAYEGHALSARSTDRHDVKPGAGGANFLSWEIVCPRQDPRDGRERTNWLDTLDPVTWQMTVQVNRPIRDGVHGINLWSADRQIMWGWAEYGMRLKPGTHRFQYSMPSLPLRPGVYTWQVSLYDGHDLLDMWHCVPDLIIAAPPMTHPVDEWAGVLNTPCVFKIRGEGE